MKVASQALESFIDQTIQRARAQGYVPTKFINMRDKMRTIPAISQLVSSGDVQSGFKRLYALGLLERFRRCLNRVCCQISLVCDSTWRLAGRPDCHATTSFDGFT